MVASSQRNFYVSLNVRHRRGNFCHLDCFKYQNQIGFVFFKSASNFEPKVLLFDMSCLLCALFWPALICSYGTFATDRIEYVADTAYDSNWYEYPMEVRKHIILCILRAQEPVYFMGHGVVRATLEVFGKVTIVLRTEFDFDFFSNLFNDRFFIVCSYSEHLAHTI